MRFAVVGPLLAAPPPHGKLRAEALAKQEWRRDRRAGALLLRDDAGTTRRGEPNRILSALSAAGCGAGRSRTLLAPLALQAQQHPNWSVQLHHDNLKALAESDPSLGSLPCHHGTLHASARVAAQTAAEAGEREAAAAARREQREIRSYEHTHGLWHADFRSLRVLDKRGRWHTLLAVLDDHSRFACHLQWWETAQNFVHGLSQALTRPAAGDGQRQGGDRRRGAGRAA